MKDSGLELLDELLSNEGKTPRRTTKKQKEEIFFGLKYITEKDWIALGCPPWGFTTARKAQFEKGTIPYLEILLEYHEKAITLLKLTNTIEWWSVVDEYKLEDCKKELKKFKEDNSLSKGDMAELYDIIYHNDYSRKSIISGLNKVARDLALLKNVNFQELVKIPVNVPPKLNFVKLKTDNSEQEINEILATVLENPKIMSPNACEEHPNYRGLRKPRNGCIGCIRFHASNEKAGIRETRTRNAN